MADPKKIAAEYSKLCLEINKLQTLKDELRIQILEEYKKGTKFDNTDINIEVANKFDLVETHKLWVSKGLKIPMKRIPAHDEIDEATLKVKAKEDNVAVFNKEYRVKTSGA